MLTWFPHTFFICNAGPRVRAPVDVPVGKWKGLDLQFIKRQRFNGLRFPFLVHRNWPIALKTGVDNLRATL